MHDILTTLLAQTMPVISYLIVSGVGVVVMAGLAKWTRLTGQQLDSVQAEQLKTSVAGALQAALLLALKSSPSSVITSAIVQQAISAVPAMVAKSNAGNIKHFGDKASPAVLERLATSALPGVLAGLNTVVSSIAGNPMVENNVLSAAPYSADPMVKISGSPDNRKL